MSALQQQARALGDPTRHGIFQYLVEAARAVDVAELTEHFGLNHNAIRQHLAKLLDAGLVVEESVRRQGPGRPRLAYRPHPATDSRWGVAGPYERLSLLLSEIVRTGETPVEVGRRAGRRMRLRSSKGDGTSRSDGAPRSDDVPRSDDPRPDGRPRDVAEDERADPVAELVEVMAQQGFEPTVKENGATVVVDLGHCPFATTALADPDTVCSIHLGMAEGITEWAGGLVVDELIPHDPRQGHCRLRVHRTTATSR